MADNQIQFGSKEYSEIINESYDEALLNCMDIY